MLSFGGCGCVYHEHCLSHWLHKRNVCPIHESQCRSVCRNTVWRMPPQIVSSASDRELRLRPPPGGPDGAATRGFGPAGVRRVGPSQRSIGVAHTRNALPLHQPLHGPRAAACSVGTKTARSPNSDPARSPVHTVHARRWQPTAPRMCPALLGT